MIKRKYVRTAGLCAAVVCMVCVCLNLTACKAENEENSKEPVRVVLTTGLNRDEIFRIENKSCYMPEMMVYLTTQQNRYEAVYGSQIWNLGTELQDNLKENVLAEISQVKAMTLLAVRKEISLTAGEEAAVGNAATAYYASLSDIEISSLGVTQENLTEMYRDYALADKVYREIIKDINPEISDDEARTITVQHILFKTEAENAYGTLVAMSDSEKAAVYRTARQVLDAAQTGEAFEALIEKYSEDPQGTLSFSKGEREKTFEDAAFNLGNGELSDIIETSRGYEIIKCINTFNREETDRNKIKIVEKRKEEVFEQEYDEFVKTLPKKFNSPLWKEVELLRNEDVNTDQFFDIYYDMVGSRILDKDE